MFRHRCQATVHNEYGSVMEAKLDWCKCQEGKSVLQVKSTSVKFH